MERGERRRIACVRARVSASADKFKRYSAASRQRQKKEFKIRGRTQQEEVKWKSGIPILENWNGIPNSIQIS